MFFVVVHGGRWEILKQIYLFLLKIYYNWSTIYGKSHDVHVNKMIRDVIKYTLKNKISNIFFLKPNKFSIILNNNFINNWFRKNIISKEVLIFNNNFSPRELTQFARTLHNIWRGWSSNSQTPPLIQLANVNF